jgi:predicted metal-binding membrane protein
VDRETVMIDAAHGHVNLHAFDVSAFLLVVCMWQTMMIAMMLPVVLPWISMLDVIASATNSRSGRVDRLTGFFGGYFGAWLLYSLGATVAQLSLQQTSWLDLDAKLSSALGGAVLLVAGVFQFTPWKRACLTHCRSPLSYFLSRWHNGPPHGWRIGLEHGLFCVGCCWALMAVGFAVGLMNFAWMAVITVIVAAEQLLPRGEWVGRGCGVALSLWGLRMMLT